MSPRFSLPRFFPPPEKKQETRNSWTFCFQQYFLHMSGCRIVEKMAESQSGPPRFDLVSSFYSSCEYICAGVSRCEYSCAGVKSCEYSCAGVDSYEYSCACRCE